MAPLFTGTANNTVVATFDELDFDNTQSQLSILSGFGGVEIFTIVDGSALPKGVLA